MISTRKICTEIHATVLASALTISSAVGAGPRNAAPLIIRPWLLLQDSGVVKNQEPGLFKDSKFFQPS